MRALILLTCLLLTAFTVTPASAKSIRLVSHPSAAEVKTACDNAGGTFVDDSQLGGGDGYACTKKNCDGKGGDCAVSCHGDGNCTGITPDRITTRPIPLEETDHSAEPEHSVKADATLETGQDGSGDLPDMQTPTKGTMTRSK